MGCQPFSQLTLIRLMNEWKIFYIFGCEILKLLKYTFFPCFIILISYQFKEVTHFTFLLQLSAVPPLHLTPAWPLFITINIDNNKIVSLLNSCNICQLRFHVIMFTNLCPSKHAFPPVRLLHHTASKYILLTYQSILAIVAPSTWPCHPSTPTSPGQPAWTRSGTRQSQLCKMHLYYTLPSIQIEG